ncbi:MAG TPA: S8 family serine peptidase [Solirubrobacterales bacterium]
MPKEVRCAALVLATVALLTLLTVISVPHAKAAEERGRYIIVLADSVEHPVAVAKRHAKSRDADLGYVYRHAIKGYSAELPNAAVEGLRNDPRVKSVTRDHVLQLFSQSIPTGIDRVFATTNETLAINEEDDLRVDADVAVIDTGVDEHEDLNVVGRTDCAISDEEEEGIFECVDETGSDYADHGTHVAGTVGALDNGKGVVGVAPGARIWSVRVYLFSIPPGFFESSAVAGVDWVAATRQDEDPENDIEVANMSFGCTEGVHFGCSPLTALDSAISNAVEEGVVMVAAAGNESTDASKTYPASHPDVITVSALEDLDGSPGEGNDPLAEFSNFGSVIDVAAPGVEILSTVPGGYEEGWSGTSMASPHVAGAAAILAAQSQPESKEDVEAIRETIVEEGNFEWEDTSGDEIQEPLLDVSNETVFNLGGSPTIEIQSASSVAPTKATLNGDVNPNGSETTYQFEYGTTKEYGSKAPASPKSIGSGTSPVEVSEKIEGLKPETTYHFRLVATNGKGTTEGTDQTFTTPAWEILSTPNPKEASDSNLYDVSCEPSTNVCTAVGKSTTSGVDSPVAQRWNGTSWSEQTAAKKSGSTHNRLFGVDCPSETRCLAVGNYQNSEGGPATLAEIWNESKWSVQSTPVPSEATSSELVAVGCNSTAQCRAAGSAVIGGVKTAIVEAWLSPTWTLQTIPIPEGATSSQLDGVDCLWSNFCVAVGRYTTSGGSIKSLAMLWNGTSWSLQTLTDPEGAVMSTLLDVSCTPSPSRCTAVGGWKNSANEQFTLAYRYNGSTWTLQSTPNPSGSIASVFQEVSCATETSCTAAGSWVESASNQTLAEQWNGSSWSIQGTPNPSGATFSAFFGVSCRSTTCMGVGWSTDGSGADTTLAEIRE